MLTLISMVFDVPVIQTHVVKYRLVAMVLSRTFIEMHSISNFIPLLYLSMVGKLDVGQRNLSSHHHFPLSRIKQHSIKLSLTSIHQLYPIILLHWSHRKEVILVQQLLLIVLWRSYLLKNLLKHSTIHLITISVNHNFVNTPLMNDLDHYI